jgi:hypothetical protein
VSGFLSKIVDYLFKEEFANRPFFKVCAAFVRVMLVYKGLLLGLPGVYSADLDFMDREYRIRELFFDIVSGFDKLLCPLVNEII